MVTGFASWGQENPADFQEQQHAIPIPVEVMVGDKWSMFQTIIAKDFGSKKNFNFFNLINYEVEYNGEENISYIVQSIFSYKINHFLALGAGANLKAFGGFKPLIAAQFTHFNRNIGLVIQPSVELSNVGVSEIFGLFEWTPSPEKKWSPFLGIQGAINMTTNGWNHEFSYANFRAGVQHGIFKFGPAVNSRFIGKNLHSEWNVGGFVSISIY